MATFKYYDGTKYNRITGGLVPKTTKTTSDTETYSCNYVNNEVDKLLPENSKTTGTTNTYSCDYINNTINGIVESGSNEYGNWIKYNDGTMICTRTISMTISCTQQWGSLYYGTNTDQWNFSQTFIAPPIMSIKCIKTGNSSFFDGEYTGLEIGNSYFKNIDIMRPNSFNDIALSVHIIAIGKWK